jgi:prevent-host-death family protein
MRAPAARRSEDSVPLTELKTQVADVLRRVKRRAHPVVITERGKPAGIVLSPVAYEALLSKLAFLQGLHEGLSEAEAGLGSDHADVVAEARKRYARR